MNNLTIRKENGALWAESREVAEMVGKRHDHLVRDIRGYIAVLSTDPNFGGSNTKPNFGPSDFFLESNYMDTTGRTLPCFLISKKGCEMVANKLTGEKGVLFTAMYVTRFNEMEERQRPTCIEDVMIQSLQEMKQVKAQLAAVSDRVEGIREVVSLSPNGWRKDCQKMIARIAQARGGAYQETNAEVFRLVDERAGVSLETRLTNKRRRMAEEGVCKSRRDKLTKVDVIAEDKKLIEIYLAVVKEMAVKNGVAAPESKAS